jgi:alpha-glucosidase
LYDHAAINVEALERDPTSILHLYRRLIHLRRAHLALITGKLQFVTADQHLFSFQLVEENECLLVLLNLVYGPVNVQLCIVRRNA